VIVIDASAALELVLNTAASRKVRARTVESGEALHAPHLIDLEILQVLRRHIVSKSLTAEVAGWSLDAWSGLKVTRYSHDRFSRRVFALRDNFTAYDAAYIALAEALGAPLVTHDAKIARTKGHSARIELV
jgi:predicted nucleic acid-binding protein